MKPMNLRKTLIAAALASVNLLGAAALAQAPQGGYGPGGMGPGMMDPGMMGPGTMGPGTMGPGMMGPGMMGPGMMGPGMMGGHGMGSGMMGPGMMGGYGAGPGFGPNLTDEQRGKIAKVQDELRQKHWTLTLTMQEEQLRLRKLYYADKRDDAAVSKSYKKILDLQQQIFDASLASQKQLDAIFTKEQREQSRRGGYGMWGH